MRFRERVTDALCALLVLLLYFVDTFKFPIAIVLTILGGGWALKVIGVLP